MLPFPKVLAAHNLKLTTRSCRFWLQEETFDPPGDINGAQVKPAGMHVIRFPFLDDLREPPQAVSAAGGIIRMFSLTSLLTLRGTADGRALWSFYS